MTTEWTWMMSNHPFLLFIHYLIMSPSYIVDTKSTINNYSPPIHVPHNEGMSNTVVHPTAWQGRSLHLVGDRTSYYDSEVILAQHIARWPTNIHNGCLAGWNHHQHAHPFIYHGLTIRYIPFTNFGFINNGQKNKLPKGSASMEDTKGHHDSYLLVADIMEQWIQTNGIDWHTNCWVLGVVD